MNPTEEARGLNPEEAQARLARFGPNRLFTPAPVRFWAIAAEVGNEFRAKRAIAALERIAAPKARVRRAGQVVTIDTETVVPGDMLILVPGTRFAADARLISAINLSVDEAALTGESLPAEKAVGDV